MTLTLTLTRQLLPFAVPEGGATLRAALRFGWLDASLCAPPAAPASAQRLARRRRPPGDPTPNP